MGLIDTDGQMEIVHQAIERLTGKLEVAEVSGQTEFAHQIRSAIRRQNFRLHYLQRKAVESRIEVPVALHVLGGSSV